MIDARAKEFVLNGDVDLADTACLIAVIEIHDVPAVEDNFVQYQKLFEELGTPFPRKKKIRQPAEKGNQPGGGGGGPGPDAGKGGGPDAGKGAGPDAV